MQPLAVLGRARPRCLLLWRAVLYRTADARGANVRLDMSQTDLRELEQIAYEVKSRGAALAREFEREERELVGARPGSGA